MKRSYREPLPRTLVLLSLVGLVLTGCVTNRPHEPDVVLRPAPTPRDAVITCFRALVVDDEPRLFSVCCEPTLISVSSVSGKQREALATLARLTAASNDFRNAIVVAYGNQGWDDFCREKKPVSNGPMVTNMRLNFISEADVAQLESTPIDEHGSRASCVLPSRSSKQENPTPDNPFPDKKPKEPVRIEIVKDKSGWLVDAGSFTRGVGVKELDMMTGLIRKYRQQVGQPGVTPSDLSTQMSREMFATMFGITGLAWKAEGNTR